MIPVDDRLYDGQGWVRAPSDLTYIPEITPMHAVTPLPTADTVRYSAVSDAPGGTRAGRRARFP